MYLKEIILENFKSFGNKTRIPFLPGFTAITGPNGSGKSNIIDAILFVLGVRSPKMIRALKLTDLIYKGSKNANYCKVSLVFDNSLRKLPIERDEIILTRKIKFSPLQNNPMNYYSYFYINGKAASLNEFIELLSSANISPHCIVQQGDVTAIAEMGDVQRRKIIDEMAGISDFDKEIEKAQKERNEVERNMENIEIILGEIRRQLRQLKKERDEAIRYKNLSKELEKKNAMLAYKKRIEIEKEIKEVMHQIEIYEESKKKAEKEINLLKEKYKEKQLRFREIEDKLSEMGGEELIEIKNKIDYFKEEVIKSKEKINYYRKEILEKRGEINELRSLLNKIGKEIEQYKDKLKNLERKKELKEKEIKRLEKELFERKKEIETSDEKALEISREILKIKKLQEEKEKILSSLILNRDRIFQKKEIIDAQIKELEESKNAYEYELREIKWEIGEIKKEERERNRKKEFLEKELFEKKKKEANYGERLREIDKEIIHLQREISKIRREDIASFSLAAKEVLKLRDEGIIKGIHGIIAELGEVEERYRKALEIAAGKRIEAVVVDNDEVAAKCIEYLKKNDYGRATFLPLNKLIVGKPRGKALLAIKDKNAIGFAIDLIKFDEKYRAAFWYVFGDTIVVESLDDARRLMGGIRIVTLDGELIEPAGAITGGSLVEKKLFGLADAKRLVEMNERLNEFSKEQEELSNSMLKIKDEIGKIENELRSLPTIENEKIERLEIRKKEIEKKLSSINMELKQRYGNVEQILKSLKEIEEEIEKIKGKKKELENIRKNKEEELLRIAKKEALKEIEAIKDTLLKLKEEERNIAGDIKAVFKEIEIISLRKKDIEKKIEENKKKVRETKEKLRIEEENCNEAKNELKVYEEMEEKILRKTKGLSKERDILYKEIIEIENKIDALSTKIEASIDLISRAKARLPTLESALADLIDVNYEFHEELPSMESIKEDIKRINEELKEIQPNLRALEEYERQYERKKKFEEDYNKLKKQRDNLIKLEKEIEKKKKEAFYKVFNIIRDNFKRIYRELTESHGELILENEENPFEGGLTIKVKPEGKDLHLTALSGGEKSIASLAFIFSLQHYEPSPFYVLDEIDMFLDEKNAEKVAKMLSENSSNAQFIVISLRRITLKHAHHIYGVTINNGVSTIIGNVNLKEMEKIVEVK